MLRRILFNQVTRVQLVRLESTGNDNVEKINLNKFIKETDETLEDIGDAVDEILNEIQTITFDLDTDVQLTDGVLTIKVGEEEYVLNRQTPNRQIWLSSPLSGPRRFDLIEGEWKDKHDHIELKQLLSKELSQLFRKDIII